jgi:RNA polymerase sigma factor (TIGR02999 family)
MADVTQILSQIEQGDPSAADQLLPLVYEELRKLASQKMSHENPGQTLQATGLVHEAYVRLVDVQKAQHWDSRGHFFAAAAEAMRRILVDKARRKERPKHGGNHQRVERSDLDRVADVQSPELIDLDEALQKLEAKHPRKAELVKLRYFAGLTNKEAAQAMGVAASTADLDWAYAKSWLRVEMRETQCDGDQT